MKQVKFAQLDGENRQTAITQMFNHWYSKGWPPGAIWWDSEVDIEKDLERDFYPDEYFSFYLNDFGEVETKIG